MPTAAIVYCSATFTTAGMADDIAAHLDSRGIETRVASFDDVDTAGLGEVDYLFLGAWTHGWFVVNQHPEATWVEWTRELPTLAGPKTALFTTYKLRTGSMFPRMRKALADKSPNIGLELKAKGPRLTDEGRRALDAFIEG